MITGRPPVPIDKTKLANRPQSYEDYLRFKKYNRVLTVENANKVKYDTQATDVTTIAMARRLGFVRSSGLLCICPPNP